MSDTAPTLLDLCCASGGTSVGYARAGFKVTGVDRKARPRYPFTFIRADVLDVLADTSFLRTFDAIAASPPCQALSRTRHLRDAQGKSVSADGVNLIPQTRDGLVASGRPYVIENVDDARPHLLSPLLLCGSMFDLHVHDETGRRWLKRHRLFESNVVLSAPGPCRHREAGVRPLGVYGSMRDNVPEGGQTCRSLAEASALMGIDWMLWDDLKLSIPPAYTQHLGAQLLAYV